MGLHYKRIEKILKSIFTEDPLTIEDDDPESQKEIIDDFEDQLTDKLGHISGLSFYSYTIYGSKKKFALEIRYLHYYNFDDLFDIYFEDKKLLIRDRTCRNISPVASVEQLIKLIEIIPEHREEVRKNWEKKQKKQLEKNEKKRKILNLKIERARVKIKAFATKMNIEHHFKYNNDEESFLLIVKVNKFTSLDFPLNLDDFEPHLKIIQKYLKGVILLAREGIWFNLRASA